ncbi:MAG: site-specific integrase [Devosia sp.]
MPSPDEIKALVTHLAGRWRPLLLTAIFTGLRASELRGLRWSDVDLENEKVIHVRQRADRFNQIGRPKSEAGERAVPLAPIVINTLREWKLACPRRNDGTKDDPVMVLDLVFPNGQGRVESLANIINRGLVPAQISAGIATGTGEVDDEGHPILAAKYTGMHALRHFYASWLINSRAAGGLELPAKEVQERMGHATIALTIDVYSHLFPRADVHDALAEAEKTLLGT